MNKFKVGDWVRCNLEKSNERYFEGVRQITGKQGMAYCVDSKYVYMANELYLVCGFVKGQDIEASVEYISSWFKGEFYSYDPTLIKPFLILRKDGTITNCIYARTIEPEYKPYSEPKLEWINEQKTIKAKGIDGFHTIYGCEKLYNNWIILIRDNETNDEDIVSLLQMFNCWEWQDNSPCGGLVEANNE